MRIGLVICRLANAKVAFTDQELPPLTELFLAVAQENGYPKSTSLEFIKVQTTSIIISLLSLRTRNTALKEVGTHDHQLFSCGPTGLQLSAV